MTAPMDINRSRDLYVAFAFAAADLLLEVEADGTICFAVGAAMSLTARPARTLTGMQLDALFKPADIPRVQRALQRIDRGERLRHLLLHTLTEDGSPVKPVAFSGYRHPHRPQARLVALTHATALEVPDDCRDPQTGVLEKDEFSDLARRMLSEACAGEDGEHYRLSLLEIPQAEQVRQEVGAVAADDFLSQLGGTLKAYSVGGDAVGDLGHNRYGIIHAPNVEGTSLEQTINDLLGKFLPKESFAPIQVTSLSLDEESISAEEAANALLYTLNSFSQAGHLCLENFSSGAQPRLSQTVAQMRQFKAVIEAGHFDMLYQPIVDLWTNVVHHFECLVRFPGQESPFETVTFAESVGIVGKLDLAILTRAIDVLRSPVGRHEALRLAVNLSGRSISHPATARKVLEIVETCRDLRGRLLFELTESAEVSNLDAVNGVLQALRRMGFHVCLDDFGAGAAAFHYVRSLQVDHVKIDGSYVKEVDGSGESTPYLRAISSLCSDLKIGTIAEYVETQKTVNLLKLLKVRFGQGYLFGKPTRPRPDADNPIKAWTVDSLYWQNGLLTWRPPND